MLCIKYTTPWLPLLGIILCIFKGKLLWQIKTLASVTKYFTFVVFGCYVFFFFCTCLCFCFFFFLCVYFNFYLFLSQHLFCLHYFTCEIRVGKMYKIRHTDTGLLKSSYKVNSQAPQQPESCHVLLEGRIGEHCTFSAGTPRGKGDN